MKSGVRTTLQYLPLALQFLGMSGALAYVSFAAPVTQRLIEQSKGKVAVQAPSRVFVEHLGLMKATFVVLFLVSVSSVLFTRARMREEADRAIVQGAVVSLVWYVGVTALGGMVMASLLPYFALNAVP